VGARALSPLASEIESQTIRWISELIGYPTTGGGILVSGGNVANFVGFLAARRAKLPWDVRSEGLVAGEGEPRVYASKETHTWIQKAADLFGFGLNAIRWIPTNKQHQIDTHALEQQIVADLAMGALPFLVVGAAGTVGVGAVDPLPEIAEICKKYNLWFHVDGAYGAPAAVLPEAPPPNEPWWHASQEYSLSSG
jgi:glutamate/tyrosine decarboxylase-like PLP-dependent enzyme